LLLLQNYTNHPFWRLDIGNIDKEVAIENYLIANLGYDEKVLSPTVVRQLTTDDNGYNAGGFASYMPRFLQKSRSRRRKKASDQSKSDYLLELCLAV
jgi:hypothetical protein